MNEYKYHALSSTPAGPADAIGQGRTQIRLIKLHSGTEGESLRCEIEHFDIESAATIGYWALSYVWGDRTQHSFIETPEGRLGVTKNLRDALLHLRKAGLSSRLWVDALCINQYDILERSGQVACMGSIYRKATCVFVWIGNVTPEANPFLFFERLRDKVLGVVDSKHSMNSSRNRWNVAYAAITEVRSVSQSAVKLLAWLLCHEWFRRKWVIQEVALAQKALLTCGNFSCDWQTIRTFARACETGPLLEKIRTRIHDLEDEDHRWKERATRGLDNAILMAYVSHGSSFFSYNSSEEGNSGLFKFGLLLVCTSHFDCTDARDHVIAILSLMVEQDPDKAASVSPLQNYGLTFEEMFHGMVKWLVIHEGYTILRQVTSRFQTCSIRESRPSHSSLPSWCDLPPYSGQNQFVGFDPTHPLAVYARNKRDIAGLRALAIEKLAPEFLSNSRILRARGRQVGVIVCMGLATFANTDERISPGLTPPDEHQEPGAQNVFTPSQRVEPQRFEDSYSSTIPADRLRDFASYLQEYRRSGSLLNPHLPKSPWKVGNAFYGNRDLTRDQSWEAWTMDQLRDEVTVRNRSLCRVNLHPHYLKPKESNENEEKDRSGAKMTGFENQVALAPQHSRVGDVLVAFHGCVSLFLLRPCGHGHWTLLGEVITPDHGLVGPKEQMTEGWASESFDLC